MDEKKIKLYTLAFAIAFLPPIWAVLAPYIGNSVGPVALITSGIYVANGNKRSDALKMCIGNVLGVGWALAVIYLTHYINFQPDVVLYVVLFVLGFVAVIVANAFSKFIYLPSLLSGWAIALVIMSPLPINELGTLPLQIAVAMVVGILYVGVGVDAFQQFLIRKLSK